MGNLMNFIKKLLGFDKIEANIAVANKLLEEATVKKDEAEQALKVVQEQEELAKLTPKERATRKNDPWVGVLNTHVNKDNVRNGFFELDWNEPFVLKLKQEGYGFDGDKDEEIVDRWFRELCANVVVDGDFGGPINTGVIDINEVKRKNQTQ
jgi:hypothetical protein